MSLIHLTIERPTKGRFADVSHNIVRLPVAIFLKLQESIFLLYATKFSYVRSLVKRLVMGLPNNLLPEFPGQCPRKMGSRVFETQNTPENARKHDTSVRETHWLEGRYAKKRFKESVRALLCANAGGKPPPTGPLQLSVRDAVGRSALMRAVAQDDAEMVSLLLEAGAPRDDGVKLRTIDCNLQPGRPKWRGIAAVGSKLFCAPHDASVVLVMDAETEAVHTIACGVEGDFKWCGIVAVGTKLFLSLIHI